MEIPMEIWQEIIYHIPDPQTYEIVRLISKEINQMLNMFIAKSTYTLNDQRMCDTRLPNGIKHGKSTYFSEEERATDGTYCRTKNYYWGVQHGKQTYADEAYRGPYDRIEMGTETFYFGEIYGFSYHIHKFEEEAQIYDLTERNHDTGDEFRYTFTRVDRYAISEPYELTEGDIHYYITPVPAIFYL